ncbi:hypothetical protein [Solilutibacter silvestris]|uniref:hypothetical protein n=1 Tax=Solilutibacter silvestris TaxID=1645665 RepID=UPI003D32E7CD
MSVVDPLESMPMTMTIDRLFKSEFGEVRLIVKGLNAVEAKTLYTLCKIGMQAAMDDALLEVEDTAALEA